MYELAAGGLRWVSVGLRRRRARDECPVCRAARGYGRRLRGRPRRRAAPRRRAHVLAPDARERAMSRTDELEVIAIAGHAVYWRGRPLGYVMPDGPWFRWAARNGAWGAARTQEAALLHLAEAMHLKPRQISPRVDELCRAEGHASESNPNYVGGRGEGRRCTRCGQTWVEYPDGAIT